MSLIAEDGTGLPDAASYIDVDFATAFHAARGNAAWGDADLEVQEAALVRATDYIDLTYGQRLAGLPLSLLQTLAFPRYLPASLGSGASWVAPDSVPLRKSLKHACASLALRVISGVDLFPQAEKEITKEVVGEIETTYALPTAPRFSDVDALMAPLLKSAAAGVAVKLFRC